MTDEIKKQIEVLKKVIAPIPDELTYELTTVYQKKRDPENPGQMIQDKTKKPIQVRLDIFDPKDPKRRPWAHYHDMPDHPMYRPDCEENAKSLCLVKPEILKLIELIEEKQNGN